MVAYFSRVGELLWHACIRYLMHILCYGSSLSILIAANFVCAGWPWRATPTRTLSHNLLMFWNVRFESVMMYHQHRLTCSNKPSLTLCLWKAHYLTTKSQTDFQIMKGNVPCSWTVSSTWEIRLTCSADNKISTTGMLHSLVSTNHPKISMNCAEYHGVSAPRPTIKSRNQKTSMEFDESHKIPPNLHIGHANTPYMLNKAEFDVVHFAGQLKDVHQILDVQTQEFQVLGTESCGNFMSHVHSRRKTLDIKYDLNDLCWWFSTYESLFSHMSLTFVK